MSSLVHVPNATRVSRYFRPIASAQCEYVTLKSKFGIAFRRAEGSIPLATVLSGKDAHSEAPIVAPNQRAALLVGTIQPYKYTAIVAVNPAFNNIATVQAPQLVEPGEPIPLILVINAHKEVDLAAFEWYCRVYLFE